MKPIFERFYIIDRVELFFSTFLPLTYKKPKVTFENEKNNS